MKVPVMNSLRFIAAVLLVAAASLAQARITELNVQSSAVAKRFAP